MRRILQNCEFIIIVCSFCSFYRVMGHGKTWLTSARNAEMPSGMWNYNYQTLNHHHLTSLLGRTKIKLSDCRIKGPSQDATRAECQVTLDEANYMLGKIEFVDLRCAEAFSCLEGQYTNKIGLRSVVSSKSIYSYCFTTDLSPILVLTTYDFLITSL
jgi:hypothetical protein